jgi:hypothetical protein
MNALKVEVVRKGSEKGLEVGHRAEYPGIPQNTPVPAALDSPLDATGISLHARLRKEAQGWSLAVSFDPEEIAGFRGLGIGVRQLAQDGSPLVTTTTSTTHEFLQANRVVTLLVPDPRPGLASLRLAVADAASGRTGSLTIPIP